MTQAVGPRVPSLVIGADSVRSSEAIAGDPAGVLDPVDIVSVLNSLPDGDDTDADKFVVGVRRRTPIGKFVFGSTARNHLLGTDRTVRCVPIAE